MFYNKKRNWLMAELRRNFYLSALSSSTGTDVLKMWEFQCAPLLHSSGESRDGWKGKYICVQKSLQFQICIWKHILGLYVFSIPLSQTQTRLLTVRECDSLYEAWLYFSVDFQLRLFLLLWCWRCWWNEWEKKIRNWRTIKGETC